ncbi:MAG: hypothetical protein ACI4XL_05660 [Bacillus sp. (in: firmicutes)]
MEKREETMNITFELQGEPPMWAPEAKWYYENALGEPWIATIEKDQVIISGHDIGWEEIIMTPEQTEEVLACLLSRASNSEDFMDHPLAKWILDKGEKLWVLSVLMVALETF